MKQGYILNLNDWKKSIMCKGDDYSECLRRGKSLRKRIPAINEEMLRRYEESDGCIRAEDIMDDLFSEYDADFFLSHSHKDLPEVTAFAGYLDWLGRKPFVDAFVWGSASELLEKVNDRYSREPNGALNYKGVLHDAAQIYMILNGALINMMNKTTNYVLLESSESIQGGDTDSPWIYSEILYSRILCPKPLSEEQNILAHSAKVKFPAYTDHLISLDPDTITQKFAKQRIVYVNKH